MCLWLWLTDRQRWFCFRFDLTAKQIWLHDHRHQEFQTKAYMLTYRGKFDVFFPTDFWFISRFQFEMLFLFSHSLARSLFLPLFLSFASSSELFTRFIIKIRVIHSNSEHSAHILPLTCARTSNAYFNMKIEN